MSDVRPYHRDNLEAVLLERALEIISERGPQALSLRALGSSAGVSRAAPYHYFPSKTALLQRIGEIGFSRLGSAIEQAAAAAGDPLSRAIAGFRAYLAFALSEPALFELMFAGLLARDGAGGSEAAGSPFPFSSPAAESAFAMLVRGVAEVLAPPAGEAAGPLAAANMCWAYVHGISMLAIGDNLKGVGPEEILVRGLKALLSRA